MKKLLIPALVLSVLSLAAVSINSKWKNVKSPQLVLLDSAQVFDLSEVRKIKPSEESLAEAAHLSVLAQRDTDGSARPGRYLLSLRTFPIRHVYESYAEALNELNEDEDRTSKLQGLDDSLLGVVRTNDYIKAAEYALARLDTASSIQLLEWCMTDDTAAYRLVDRDETFRALDNYPDYYYMMDNYVAKDSVVGYQSTLRTLRFTEAATLPLAIGLDVINKSYEYQEDSITGNYINPYALRDDAMRDFVRADRFGRFSRETDHSVQYVATLHLSDRYFTYIYSIQDWDGMAIKEESLTDEISEDSVSAAIDPLPDSSSDEDAQLVTVPAHAAVYDPVNKIHIVNVDRYGKRIADQQIACKCSAIHISTAAIDKSGTIVVTDQEQKWAKDPLVAGFAGNKVISRNVTAVTRYRVKANGEIVAVTDGATAKAQ